MTEISGIVQRGWLSARCSSHFCTWAWMKEERLTRLAVLSLLPRGFREISSDTRRLGAASSESSGHCVVKAAAHGHIWWIKGLKPKEGRADSVPRARPEQHKKLLPPPSRGKLLYFLTTDLRAPRKQLQQSWDMGLPSWQPKTQPSFQPSLLGLTFWMLVMQGHMPHCENTAALWRFNSCNSTPDIFHHGSSSRSYYPWITVIFLFLFPCLWKNVIIGHNCVKPK